jgi:hypothetical protein
MDKAMSATLVLTETVNAILKIPKERPALNLFMFLISHWLSLPKSFLILIMSK